MYVGEKAKGVLTLISCTLYTSHFCTEINVAADYQVRTSRYPLLESTWYVVVAMSVVIMKACTSSTIWIYTNVRLARRRAD